MVQNSAERGNDPYELGSVSCCTTLICANVLSFTAADVAKSRMRTLQAEPLCMCEKLC